MVYRSRKVAGGAVGDEETASVDTGHTAPDSPCRLTSTAGRIKSTLILVCLLVNFFLLVFVLINIEEKTIHLPDLIVEFIFLCSG
jgi:uncharacterized integral membrane protein